MGSGVRAAAGAVVRAALVARGSFTGAFVVRVALAAVAARAALEAFTALVALVVFAAFAAWLALAAPVFAAFAAGARWAAFAGAAGLALLAPLAGRVVLAVLLAGALVGMASLSLPQKGIRTGLAGCMPPLEPGGSSVQRQPVQPNQTTLVKPAPDVPARQHKRHR